MPITAVIYGANGPTGTALCRELSGKGYEVKAVSRSGKLKLVEGLPNVTMIAGNCLNPQDCLNISKGADQVFCCVGLPYYAAIWERDFPVILANVINSTPPDSVFVLADNLYCFGPEAAKAGRILSPDIPYTKTGGKPGVRAKLDQFVLEAHGKKCNTALVRAADFYGPEVETSMYGEVAFGRMIEGDSPRVMKNTDKLHTFTYIPDLARALSLVADKKEAWGKAWHCPNAPPITVADALGLAAEMMGKPRKLSERPMKLGGSLGKVLSVFMPDVKELQEMLFQWEYDFVVDHEAFLQMFPDFKFTPFKEGVQATIDWYRKRLESRNRK